MMSEKQHRIVFQRTDGTWVNKRNNEKKVSSLHRTQHEAEDAARQLLIKQGGGELTTKGIDGRIRKKDTVAPGNDPCPPRDK
jgi:hypothetical protein